MIRPARYGDLIRSSSQIIEHASGVNPKKAVNLDLCRSTDGDDPTTYFTDEKRKIDFVLVYEERHCSNSGGLQTQASIVAEDEAAVQPPPEGGKGKK